MPEPVPQLGAQGLHGIFEKLASMDVADGGVVDVYDPQLADFYDAFMADFGADIPHYERLVPPHGGEVLDLACGAGRISIALARSGHNVLGVDLSTAMLDLGRASLALEGADISDRVSFVHGDISSFDFGARFDLIVLGITSISLLPDRSSRIGMFASVANHLKADGRFVFDILDLEGETWRRFDNFHDVWTVPNDAGTDFAVVGQRFYPEERKFVLNMYRETIGWNGDTRRILGRSVKIWLGRDELIGEMAEAGLGFIKDFVEGDQRYFVAGLAS